jgi:hypothetical protein
VRPVPLYTRRVEHKYAPLWRDMPPKKKRTVTIKSSGGLTRAVNGDVAPEPSRLKADHGPADGAYQVARQPPPPSSILAALNEARGLIRKAVPRAASVPLPRATKPVDPAPPPPTPAVRPRETTFQPPPPKKRFGPFVSGTEVDVPTLMMSDPLPPDVAAWKRTRVGGNFPPAVPMGKPHRVCRCCNVLPETFACWPCCHTSACFACADGRDTCFECKAVAVAFYRSRVCEL